MSKAVDILAPHFSPSLKSLRPRHSGIYFLILRDEIVYVGQSVDVESRIAGHGICHVRSKRHHARLIDMKFDRYAWIAVDPVDLDAYEAAFIRRLAPRFNMSFPCGAERDAEILAKFDLPEPSPRRVAAMTLRRKKTFTAARHETVRMQRARLATGTWLAYQLAGIES